MTLNVLVALVGYLIGTISFARIAGRMALPGEDISVTEYPVPGEETTSTYRGVSASSVMERAGWKWGVSVIVLDALKAFIPTLVVRLAFPDSSAYLIVAVAVIVGHNWPVWWNFFGGRGQASMLGAMLAIDILAIPVAVLAGSVVGLVVFTSVYMARNMSPALLIPWFWFTSDIDHVLFALAVNIAYWVASRGDVAEELRIRRLRGIPDLSYPQRLRLAWHDFFTEDME